MESEKSNTFGTVVFKGMKLPLQRSEQFSGGEGLLGCAKLESTAHSARTAEDKAMKFLILAECGVCCRVEGTVAPTAGWDPYSLVSISSHRIMRQVASVPYGRQDIDDMLY